jgi:hypothetical protein
MTLEQLMARFRIEADDRVAPYLWADEWLIDWFDEAQNEAAIRARLLLDDYTPEICQIAVTPGTDSYALHPKLYEIAHLRFVSTDRPSEPKLVTREWLDRMKPEWRSLPQDVPKWAIQTDTRLRLVPMPSVSGTLQLEAYRLPMDDMVEYADVPEIHQAHHIHLIQWVLYRAFSKPDADAHDPQRAERAYANFEQYFGKRPDADLRRSTRQDEVQANVSYVL